MIRLVILGPPGVGKGTQSKLIVDEYKIPQIATGDMLRATSKRDDDLGRKILCMIRAGSLVPDDIVIQLVKQRVQHDDCKYGYLLDGFPRTIVQAESLKNANILVDIVIELVADMQSIVQRLSGRRIHMASGRTYHVLYNPPKRDGCDDITGEPLVQRDDDIEEVIINRMHVYQNQTAPLIQYYENSDCVYHKVNGLASVDEVQSSIKIIIDQFIGKYHA